jgi:subtilisin family serine protease
VQNYWSFWKKDVQLTEGDQIQLQPIKLTFADCKRFFYGEADENAGAGVRVGVVDSGVGPHPDLVVTSGLCTVLNDDAHDFADIEQHGTHVAGIIAARGQAPNGIRGVAPAVDLLAYRVFWKGAQLASSYPIVKAIEQAVQDQCDLINMSLGGGDPDEGLEKAIVHAYEHGTIVFVASGNDGRQKVCFPASFSLSVAVGAMGRRGTFPANTTDRPNIMSPFGTDSKDFVAAFSNIGPEIDLMAPGVGVLSTVPGGGYAAMSGTSMACPMATGLAACLLADRPDLLALPRDSARSEAMLQFVCSQAKTFGFEAIFEGLGGLFP